MITDFWGEPAAEKKAKSKYVYATQRAYYLRNQEKLKARSKAYNASNKEKIKARKQRYRKHHAKESRAKQRTWELKYNYGLTPEGWQRLFESNGKKCMICGRSDFGKRGPQIDHCHATNRVRGILCHLCNMAIGLLNDDIAVLESAVKYLKDNKT